MVSDVIIVNEEMILFIYTYKGYPAQIKAMKNILFKVQGEASITSFRPCTTGKGPSLQLSLPTSS